MSTTIFVLFLFAAAVSFTLADDPVEETVNVGEKFKCSIFGDCKTEQREKEKEEKLQVLEKKVTELEINFNASQEKIASLENEYKILVEKNSELQMKISTCESANVNLAKEKDDCLANGKSLSDRLEEQKIEMEKSIEAVNQVCIKKLQDFQTQCKQKEASLKIEIEKKEQNITFCSEQNNKCKQSLEKCEEEMKIQVTAGEEKIANLSQSLQFSTDKIAEVTSARNQCEESQKTLNATFRTCEDDKATVEAELTKLKVEMKANHGESTGELEKCRTKLTCWEKQFMALKTSKKPVRGQNGRPPPGHYQGYCRLAPC